MPFLYLCWIKRCLCTNARIWLLFHATSHIRYCLYGPLAIYVKLRVAHAPGTFPPPPRVSDPDMHHGTYVTHVPWCMPWSLTKGFLWCRWRGKRTRHSRRMRNPQFYVSGKRPIHSSINTRHPPLSLCCMQLITVAVAKPGESGYITLHRDSKCVCFLASLSRGGLVITLCHSWCQFTFKPSFTNRD